MPSSDRIVVLDGHTLSPGDISWEAVQKLGRVDIHPRTGGDDFAARAAGAEILITNKVPITAERIAALPALKFIVVTATGYNVVDTAAARTRGIPVSNVPEYGTNTVAEFTLALLLELSRGVGRHAQSVAAGDWQRSPDWCYSLTPQFELAGKTLGIIGFGRIGRRVGELARAFGMNVVATGTKAGASPAYQPFRWATLDELVAASDFITLHCPQTASNKQMVNDALIRKMKPSAYLINAGRGTLVDEQALADHLNRGTIAGAALDVVSVEPVAASNPLLKAKNCLITPHMAWTAVEARRRIMQTTAQNIAAFQNGAPLNVVNP